VNRVIESFEISLQVQTRLKDIAEYKGDLHYRDVANQCLKVIHIVNSQWRAGRQIFQESEPLFLPPPAQISYPAMHEIRLQVSPNEQQSLREICMKYRVDKQSALSWAIDCMQIIDDTLMTHRLFPSTEEGTKPLTFSWIHK
jgi:hypothetical protein